MSIYRIPRVYQKEFGIIRDYLRRSIATSEDSEYLMRDALDNSQRVIKDGSLLEKELKESQSDLYPKLDGDKSPHTSKFSSSDIEVFKKALETGGLSREDSELLSKLILTNESGKSAIFWDKSDGIETLAHEIGHAKNLTGSIFDRAVHKGATLGNKYKNLSPGLVSAIKDLIGSKLIYQEESNATKKALEMLKSKGLTTEEYQLLSKTLLLALDLYKTQGKISWRKKLVDSKVPGWLL